MPAGAGAALFAGSIAESSHTDTTAVLSSAAPASGGTGTINYQWKLKIGAGAYANVVGATLLTLSATGLAPATLHTFKRTVIDSVTSSDSNEIAITTSVTPAVVKSWTVPTNASNGTSCVIVILADDEQSVLDEGNTTAAGGKFTLPAANQAISLGTKHLAVIHNWDGNTGTNSIFGGVGIATLTAP